MREKTVRDKVLTYFLVSRGSRGGCWAPYTGWMLKAGHKFSEESKRASWEVGDTLDSELMGLGKVACFQEWHPNHSKRQQPTLQDSLDDAHFPWESPSALVFLPSGQSYLYRKKHGPREMPWLTAVSNHQSNLWVKLVNPATFLPFEKFVNCVPPRVLRPSWLQEPMFQRGKPT